jgi:DNA-binding response OmpR family regulator
MAPEKKSSILLVEDEENLHEALKLNLELEGFDVTSAFDGASALNAVQGEYFDLIILDVMPYALEITKSRFSFSARRIQVQTGCLA